MFIARVRGNVVTTQKVPKMTGKKLVIIEPLQVDEEGRNFRNTGRSFVAVDYLGAGTEDLVLATQGSSARMTEVTADAPVDCVVIGIVDTVSVKDETVYARTSQ